jgi:hypothetical protein
VTVAGLKVQATEAGEQEKVTGPLNPFVAASDSVRFPAPPPVTLRVVEDACKLKLPTPVAGGATATEPKRPPFSPYDTRGEVQDIGIAQRGGLPAVLPEEYLPQADVSDRRARAGIQRADQRKRLRIEGVDHAVSEVADQKVASEAAKACRGKRHPPGCVQNALAGDSRHEVSIVVELIDIAETRTYALKCGGADLGVGNIDVSTNTMDAKRRIARWQCRIGKVTRKSMRSEGAVEDIHGTLLKVSRKQERSGRIGVKRDVGVSGLGRIVDHRNRLRPAAHIPGGNRTIERAEQEQSRCAAWNIEDSGVAVVYRAARTAVRRRGSGRRYRDEGQRRCRDSASGGIDCHRAIASLIDPNGRTHRNAPGIDQRGSVTSACTVAPSEIIFVCTYVLLVCAKAPIERVPERAPTTRM